MSRVIPQPSPSAQSSQPTSSTAPAEFAVLPTTSPVNVLMFAKTQPIAATLSGDRKLRIISLADGGERRAIDVSGRDIDVFAISPDGASVAIGDHKGRVSVWAADTGQLRCELQLARYPGLAVFSPNGAMLAITAQGDPVRLIDVASGKPKTTLGTALGGSQVLAFSRDGQFVATGDGDGVIRVYEASSGRRIAENRELLMTPLAIAFAADGKSIIAGSGDKTLVFIDAASGRTVRKLPRTAEPPMFLEVSPDGRSLAAAYMKAANMSQPDRVYILSMDSGTPQFDWLPPTFPAGGGWTSDGHLIAAFGKPDGLHLWRLR